MKSCYISKERERESSVPRASRKALQMLSRAELSWFIHNCIWSGHMYESKEILNTISGNHVLTEKEGTKKLYSN